MSEPIKVIVFKDGEGWVAQCLDYDIGAQAADLDTLRLRLETVIDAELAESIRRHNKPFQGIGKAPDRFFDMWERRRSGMGQTRTMHEASEPVTIEFAIAA